MRLARMKNAALEGKGSDDDPQRREESPVPMETQRPAARSRSRWTPSTSAPDWLPELRLDGYRALAINI